MPIERKRVDVRPYLRQFIPSKDLLQGWMCLALLQIACAAGQNYIADVVPSAGGQWKKVIDRGRVGIERMHAKGDPPPAIKTLSFLGGLKLDKLSEVLSPKVRFSHMTVLRVIFCLLNHWERHTHGKCGRSVLVEFLIGRVRDRHAIP
jgi:hypothetical protein